MWSMLCNRSKWLVFKDWECPVSLEEEEEVGVAETRPALQCYVCAGTEEQHLMTLCDTCNQYYHIGCLDPPLTKVPKKTAKWGWYVTAYLQLFTCKHLTVCTGSVTTVAIAVEMNSSQSWLTSMNQHLGLAGKLKSPKP